MRGPKHLSLDGSEGGGCPLPWLPAPQHPPLGRDRVEGGLSRVSPRPLGTSPAGGQGGILWLGRLREEKPPEICRQPFMELKAVQRNEPSFPQIMQGTVLPRTPPRIAGPAWSPSPQLPGPWEARCVTWLGCRQRRSRAQRPCLCAVPTLWQLSENRPSQHPWPGVTDTWAHLGRRWRDGPG